MIKLLEMAHIEGVSCENTGGGCMVDFIHLPGGRVIGVNEDCACLYNSLEHFYDGGIPKPTEVIDFHERSPVSEAVALRGVGVPRSEVCAPRTLFQQLQEVLLGGDLEKSQAQAALLVIAEAMLLGKIPRE